MGSPAALKGANLFARSNSSWDVLIGITQLSTKSCPKRWRWNIQFIIVNLPSLPKPSVKLINWNMRQGGEEVPQFGSDAARLKRRVATTCEIKGEWWYKGENENSYCEKFKWCLGVKDNEHWTIKFVLIEIMIMTMLANPIVRPISLIYPKQIWKGEHFR